MYKLFDSELKVMNLIWEKGSVSAKELSITANRLYGWNKNTTYTIIKKLVEKEAVLRSEPDFICTSLTKKESVQKTEVNQLINKLYEGSKRNSLLLF